MGKGSASFDFEESFGWKEGWQSDYSKISFLDNPSAFTNGVFYAFYCAFKDKDDCFEAARHMYHSITEGQDISKIKKMFSRRVSIFLTDRSKYLKTLALSADFLGRTAFISGFLMK